jgi:hypothetical protein
MKRVFVLVTLLLILLSSGCTVPFLNIEIPFLPDIFPGMQTTEKRHDVISIEGIQAIPSPTIRAGQSVRLRAVVKNLQEPEHEKIPVTIGLYNDCGLFGMETPQGVKGEFCSGSTAPVYDSNTGMVECTTTMYPQSTAVVEWKLTAKDDVNVETQCKVGILARYYYYTYSTGSVTFVNKAEIERLVSEGRSFSETGIATIGEGPVKPYIEILSQPIIIDTDPGVQDPGSGIMSFWVENKGNGILEIAEPGAAGGNVVFDCGTLFNIPTPGLPGVGSIPIHPVMLKQVCLEIENAGESVKAIKDGQKIIIQDCIKEHLETTTPNTYSISFIGRKTPKYSCSITVADTSGIKEEKTYQITAKAGYSYKFTKEITLTVQPKIRL